MVKFGGKVVKFGGKMGEFGGKIRGKMGKKERENYGVSASKC